MTAKERLLHVLALTKDTYVTRVRALQARDSAGVVHDARVSSRRVLAVIDVVETIFEVDDLARLRRAVRALLSSLGQVRDAEVQVELIEAMNTASEDFGPCVTEDQHRRLVGRLRKVRKKRLARLSLADVKPNRLARDFEAALDRASANRIKNVEDRLEHVCKTAFEKVEQRLNRIDPDDSDTFHQLRLALKKLQYLAELSRDAELGHTPERVAAMDDVIGRLGQIQDISVLRATIRQEARHRSLADIDFRPLRAQLALEEQKLISRFLTHAREVLQL